MSNLAMMMGLTAVKVDSLEFTFVGVSYPASNLNILVDRVLAGLLTSKLRLRSGGHIVKT